MESLLIITGSMGAGKTSVLAEASDILALGKIVHAAIDLDTLALAHLPSAVRAYLIACAHFKHLSEFIYLLYHNCKL